MDCFTVGPAKLRLHSAPVKAFTDINIYEERKIKTTGDAIISGKPTFLEDIRHVISFETNENYKYKYFQCLPLTDFKAC